MDERLLLLFSAFIEVLVAYQLFNHFFLRRDSINVSLVLISVAFILALAGISMLKTFQFNTITSLLLFAFYVAIVFKSKWWKALLWSAIFVLLGMISEIATSFGVSCAFNVHIENTMFMTWYKLVVYIISNSILYILVKIIITVFHSSKEVEPDKTVIYLISFPVLAILNEHLLVRMAMQLDLSKGVMAVCMIIGIGLILGGFLIIILYDRGLQKKQLEKDLILAKSKADANERFLLLQERSLSESRSAIHDFKNQLLNLRDLYESAGLEASIYHNKLMDSLKRQMDWQLIDVNNRVFSNIFQRAQIRCEQLDIRLESQISHYDLGFIDPIDTSSLFDNAFDNAILACAEMDNDQQRWIDFNLYKSSLYLICEIANSHSNSIQNDMDVLISSKEDKEHHGIGIKNIRDSANKYGGDITYSYTDSEFRLSILLFLQI